MMKTVLLTGASGLLGSHIAKQLLEDEDISLHAIKRTTSSLDLLNGLSQQITWHNADLLDVVSLSAIFRDNNIDYVIHAGAIVSYFSQDKEEMFLTNVTGTTNMVNISLKHKIKKFIFISSIAAIGKENNNHILHEESKHENQRYHSNYGLSKYQAELEVWRAHAESLPVVILNPSVIIGPGRWDKSSTQLFDYVRKGKKFYTNGLLNYVDVRDVSKITHLSLNNGKEGKYILNAGHISYKQAFADIARVFDMSPPNIKVGHKWVIMAAKIDSMLSKISGKRPMLSRETARMGKSPYIYDASKVSKDFNFQFTDWKESVKWCGETLMNRNN